MPVTDPLTSALNFTPSSTDELSGSLVVAGVADDGQIVHAMQLVGEGVTALDVDAGPVPTAFVAVPTA